MSLCKFKLFTIFLFLPLSLWAQFSDMDCLNGNFETTVAHKGKPFGIHKVKLKIKKQGCEITISHEKLKFLKKQWLVDVCRGPIHIKYGTGSVEVYKKEGYCSETEKYKEGFCYELKNLEAIIQDDGLIFAEGEKENLSSDHGKVYCAYLLLKQYLKKDTVFNRKNEYKNLLILKEAPANDDKVVCPPPKESSSQSPSFEETPKSSGAMPMGVEAEPAPKGKGSSSGSF